MRKIIHLLITASAQGFTVPRYSRTLLSRRVIVSRFSSPEGLPTPVDAEIVSTGEEMGGVPNLAEASAEIVDEQAKEKFVVQLVEDDEWNGLALEASRSTTFC